MKYEFLPFDLKRLNATKTAWLKDAKDGLAFPPTIERLFEWVETHLTHREGDSAAYGVFPRNKHVAVGICDVIVHRRSVNSKWVKMLKLELKPSVDVEMLKGESDLAMAVFTESIAGSLTLQLAHKASTLKIYGRTTEQLTFLRVLVSNVNERLGQDAKFSFKASIQGRFLVLDEK